MAELEPKDGVVIVKEFPPETGGELAGWIDVAESSKRSELIVARIAYGRIAVGGAAYSYPTIPETGARLQTFGDDLGFPVTTELELLAYRDQSTVHMHTAYMFDRSNGRESGHSQIASSFRPENRPDVDKGVWALGDQEILTAIKEALQRQQAEWLYANIYYILAHITKEEDILADPEMHDQTVEELGKAQEISSTLAEASQLDSTMRHRLTVFGDIPAKQIPNVFADSRRTAHNLETKVIDLSKDIILGRWVPRTGSVRSWPYMDASATDEDRAFGLELEDIRAGNIEYTYNQLKKEIKELDHRHEVVTGIADRLTTLSNLEVVEH